MPVIVTTFLFENTNVKRLLLFLEDKCFEAIYYIIFISIINTYFTE